MLLLPHVAFSETVSEWWEKLVWEQTDAANTAELHTVLKYIILTFAQVCIDLATLPTSIVSTLQGCQWVLRDVV